MPVPCTLCTASQRAAGSCCGSSQPREGTWPQPYRLDKALFTSQYSCDRVQKDLHALESVPCPLPGTCMAASSSVRFALSKRTWAPCKASASKVMGKCLRSVLWKKGMEACGMGLGRARVLCDVPGRHAGLLHNRASQIVPFRVLSTINNSSHLLQGHDRSPPGHF